jgi:hypothetical protein
MIIVLERLLSSEASRTATSATTTTTKTTTLYGYSEHGNCEITSNTTALLLYTMQNYKLKGINCDRGTPE